MNLTPTRRDILGAVPGLVDEIDQLTERVNVVWSVEHNPQTGVHTDVTADSVTSDAVTTEALTVNETTQTTVGAAGGASALPATPTGYLPVTINGVEYVMPFYLKA